MNSLSKTLLAALSALYLLRKLWRHSRSARRFSKVLPTEERVLILGAGTGIGRDVALRYCARGAKVCISGRRADKLVEVALEIEQRSLRTNGLLSVPADVSSIDDMIALRDTLVKEWGGCDTIIITAGVSALQPILGVAGLSNVETATELLDIEEEGIRKVLSATETATRINYYGPLVVATVFIPLLTRTSKAPAILLVSSLGAVIPAPTRALYGSTKAAALILYRAMSLEHPSVAFSFILPSTVEGSFRASAVDQGKVRESDPNKSGLKLGTVAQRCIQAVDDGDKTVFIPAAMTFAPFLWYLWPSFVESSARNKYNYHSNI